MQPVRAFASKDGKIHRNDHEAARADVVEAITRILEKKFPDKPKTVKGIADEIVRNAYEVASVLGAYNRTKAPLTREKHD